MTDAREMLFGPGNPMLPQETCDHCKEKCHVTWPLRGPVTTELICHSCKIKLDAERRERKRQANRS